MTRELTQQPNVNCIDELNSNIILTPAINRPNATPISPNPAGLVLVVAGSHKLPGASAFVSPSNSSTNITSSVDRIPSIDAYESIDKGIKRVGVRLDEPVRVV